MKNDIDIPNEVYYLVHMTKPTCKNKDGSFAWNFLKPSPVDYGMDQFPGVFFTLITKDNLLTEELFLKCYCLIFSKKLLKQHNYHINISDNNGFITENNTYFPQNLKEAVDEIKKNSFITPSETDINYHLMNEVIFHDPVPMEYCCMEINRCDLSSILETGNDFLPDYPIHNNIEPNTDLLPFYCYVPAETQNRLTSSYTFFQKMARVCNIDSSLTTEEIIQKIQEKMDFLYQNRDRQNLSLVSSLQFIRS
jgi:hypothetical protein